MNPNSIHIPAAQDDLPIAYRIVCDMENPLETIRAIMGALAMMAETLDEREGTPIQRLAWLARDQVAAAEKLRGGLFRMLHPDRDHFQSHGWPGERSMETQS